MIYHRLQSSLTGFSLTCGYLMGQQISSARRRSGLYQGNFWLLGLLPAVKRVADKLRFYHPFNHEL